MVSSCMLAGGCRDRFLMRTSYRTLDRRRFGMRMVWMLPALSASCVFPLRLYASLLRTNNWLFSLKSAICFDPRPPADMTDGWFPPVQAVSSADLFNTFLEHHTRAFSFLELAEEDLFGHAYVFHPCDVASLAQLHLKQDGLYAEQVGSLEDLFVWHIVLPFDAKNGAQAALVKPFK